MNSLSANPLGSASDAIAGMNVSDSTSDPKSANSTVSAIGRNSFPSEPSSSRIGT